MRRTAVAVLACLVSTAAWAEVRVRRDGPRQPPRLDVQATAQGPWSPVGRVDARVLNPTGDLFGHGFPGAFQDDGAVTVAWLEPSETLRVARSTGDAWSHVGSVHAESAFGVPVVVSLDGRVGVLWQAGAGSPSAWFAPVAGSEPAQLLADGHLLHAIQQGDTVHLVVLDDGALADVTVVLAIALPFDDITVGRVAVDRLGDVIVPAASSTVSSSAAAPTSPSDVDGTSAAIASLESRVHELRDDLAVLTWWGDRVLHHVALEPDGPRLPVRSVAVPGRAERPPGLARSVVNEYREER